MNSKVWFITGSSRGLGAAISKAALEAGHKVVATGRKAEDVKKALGENPSLLAVSMDVTKPDQIAHGVKLAMEKWGRIDALVNNAGYGQFGLFEEVSPEEVRTQYETNVFGLMNVTRTVLPVMRHQREGRIFNVSSMVGYKGYIAASIYSSTKFAVRSFSETLAQEVKDFGIQVSCVAPGGFRTDFIEDTSIRFGSVDIADYAKISKETKDNLLQMNGKQMGDPVKLAKAILEVASLEQQPVHFLVGTDAIGWAELENTEIQADINRFRKLSEETAVTP